MPDSPDQSNEHEIRHHMRVVFQDPGSTQKCYIEKTILSKFQHPGEWPPKTDLAKTSQQTATMRKARIKAPKTIRKDMSQSNTDPAFFRDPRFLRAHATPSRD